MSELSAIRAFYHWNAAVRRKYLEVILQLPPEARLQDRGASYPSLQEIYAHLLDGHRFWFDLVPHDRVADALKLELPARELTPERLRSATDEIDDLVNGYLAGLSEPDLSREIVTHFPGADAPTERRFPVGDVLWHMVEEELQHIGEINALLWQMDLEPPLGTYEEWTAARSASADRERT